MRSVHERNGMSPAMRMADLLDTDFSLLGVVSRMGLSLGFGEESVEQVCEKAGIDAETFLLICRVNSIEGYRPTREALQNANLHDILGYLRKSHSYYTQVMLPLVEDSLEKMVVPCEDKQKRVIRRFFLDYREELLAHFAYEEGTVFPYVEEMLSCRDNSQFTIGEYEENQQQKQLTPT